MSTANLPPERRSEIASKAARAVKNRYQPNPPCHRPARPVSCPRCKARKAEQLSRAKKLREKA